MRGVKLFSTRRPDLPFAREVNPSSKLAICSGPALVWPRQLPCQDKHASCGPVGGPERLPRRLVGFTIEDHPLLSTGNMAFLDECMHGRCWNRGPKPPKSAGHAHHAVYAKHTLRYRASFRCDSACAATSSTSLHKRDVQHVTRCRAPCKEHSAARSQVAGAVCRTTCFTLRVRCHA